MGVTTVWDGNFDLIRILANSSFGIAFSFSKDLFVASRIEFSGWPSKALGRFSFPDFFGEMSSSFVHFSPLFSLSVIQFGEFGLLLLGASLFSSPRSSAALSTLQPVFQESPACLHASSPSDVSN